MTFFSKQITPAAINLLLTILREESIHEIESPYNNWVIVKKLEYIGHLAPLTIFWRYNILNLYINVTNIGEIYDQVKELSVLSFNYQILSLPIETVPDRNTTIAMHNVLVRYFV